MMTPAEQEIAKLKRQLKVIEKIQDEVIKGKDYEKSQALDSAKWLMMAQIRRLKETNWYIVYIKTKENGILRVNTVFKSNRGYKKYKIRWKIKWKIIIW